MRENRGPEARLRDAAADTIAVLERLPSLIRDVEKLAGTVLEDGGLPLHPDTVGAIARRGAVELLGLPLWIIALALVALAIALW